MRVIQISILVAILLAITMPEQSNAMDLKGEDLLKVVRAYRDTLLSASGKIDKVMILEANGYAIMSGVDYNVNQFTQALNNYLLFLDCYIENDSAEACSRGIRENIYSMDMAYSSCIISLMRIREEPSGDQLLCIISSFNLLGEVLDVLYASTPIPSVRTYRFRRLNVEELLKPKRDLDLSNFKWESDSTRNDIEADSTSDNR